MSATMTALAPSLPVIAALVVRVSLVLALGIAVAWLCRRSGAALRHQIWLATLMGTLLTGAAGLAIVPAGWRLGPEVWPAPAGLAGGQEGQIAVACFVVWALGAIIPACRMCRAILATHGMSSRARPLDDPTWRSLLSEAKRAIGPSASPALMESDEVALPLTWGIRHPVVLLPRGAEAWPETRRRAVLLHEVAHVRRRDCAVELLIGLTGALYWFHPAVWYAVGRLRLAREQACDRMVLAAGAAASDYAADLVAVFRWATEARRVVPLGVGLGGATPLEERILALGRTDGSRLPWPGRVAVVLAPAAAALAFAVWNPTAGVAPEHRAVLKAKCDCGARHHAHAAR